MSLEPILTAPPVIQLHKIVGHTWVLCMSATAISSFWIFEIRLWGKYSPIHLLSALTLGLLVFAVYSVRMGRIHIHQYTMLGLYFFALVLTSMLAFLPGRIMHEVFISG